jgi:myo-inositol-1-phosphate synthase
MQFNDIKQERNLGIAIVGLGGAVATTAVAGSILIRKGLQDKVGLPLAEFEELDLISYDHIHYRGWDIYDDNLFEAARKHEVLNDSRLSLIEDELKAIKPWPASSNNNFCSGVTNGNDTRKSLREQIKSIENHLYDFAREIVGPVVMINLASTEHAVNTEDAIFQSVEAFEKALDENSDKISPAMLYAYAAIKTNVPYANFTPSMGVDIPALLELSARCRVPVAGKDGKTGQTFVKTVVAPALRARALKVDGWFSTNILGNRDGQALEKPESLQSKINTKGSVLDSCLNYKVDNHIVHIHYYKPRGDNKEAWDNIDVSGFLGEEMQIKVNFLCKDSILAAPLAIEIGRCLELARRKGEAGAMEEMGAFFKAPLTQDGQEAEHSFPVQQERLLAWLDELSKREDKLNAEQQAQLRETIKE